MLERVCTIENTVETCLYSGDFLSVLVLILFAFLSIKVVIFFMNLVRQIF